jgi:hypothetical protein
MDTGFFSGRKAFTNLKYVSTMVLVSIFSRLGILPLIGAWYTLVLLSKAVGKSHLENEFMSDSALCRRQVDGRPHREAE